MENLKNVLKQKGFFFKKCFGQNFIADENLLSQIVKLGEISSCDEVLEIGVGAGTLTRQIAKTAKRVVGFEIDNRLQDIISQTLEGQNNVEIIYKDFMKEPILNVEKKFANGYKVVANLPYYITTPVICRFLEEATKVKSLVIMVQEEVAERLCAKPGTKEYGAITASVNFRGSAKIIKRVPRQEFIPMPNVDSAVVKIDIEPKFFNVNYETYRLVVRSAFTSRRKTYVNNLINSFKLSREQAENLLIKSNIDITARGETLSAEQFVVISQNIGELL